jgi:putative ABC transport system permease protein
MTVLILIAWRNIWRNKLRTLVVVAAISVGLSAALFAVAFTRGMVSQLVGEVIGMETPHLLVVHEKDYGSIHSNSNSNSYTHNPDTLTESKLSLSNKPSRVPPYIHDAGGMAVELGNIEGIKHATARLILPAMLSTAHATAHVTLCGIDPSAEKDITNLHNRIKPDMGSYFESRIPNPIIIGRRLAEDLNATINTRIVATFRDRQGEVVSTLFRVSGIYTYQNSSFERGNAFVLRHELAVWHSSNPDDATEIALSLESGLPHTTAMQQTVEQWLSLQSHEQDTPNYTVQTWESLRPEVAFFYHYAGFISTIILGIILLALGLVVVNTMLMVVNERRTELGVLRALGMKDNRLITMMTFETFFMMLPGVALSLGITAILTSWLGTTGINLTMFSGDYHSPAHDYQSIITLVTTVYPVYKLSEVIRLSVMVVVTALLSSWMPVRSALRIQPADAVKDMLPPS